MISPTSRQRLISFLYAIIMLGLMAFLCLVCIKGKPLWMVTGALLLTVFWLICGILYGRPAPVTDESGNTYLPTGQELKKDRRNLLIWGLLCGVLWVSTLLVLIALPISDKTVETLQNIVYFVPVVIWLVGLCRKYLVKK